MNFHPDSTAAGILAIAKASHITTGGLPSESFAHLPRHLHHPAAEKAMVGIINGDNFLPSKNAQALIEIERTRSFVAAAINDFQQWPMHTRLVMNAVGFSGAVVAAGKPIPVKRGMLSNQTLSPKKAAVIIAVSNELLEGMDTKTVNRLNQMIASGCANTLDATIIEDVRAHSGTISIPSTGTAPANILADAKKALDAVNTAKSSGKFYWVASTDMANLLATAEENGTRAFPEISPNGGEFLNLPFIVSSQAPETDSSGGKIMLVDAGRIAFILENLGIEAGENATLEMNDDPHDPAVASLTLVSMFQSNCTAIRAIQTFGFEIIGNETMSAVIEGI